MQKSVQEEEGLLPPGFLGSTSRISDLVGLEWDPRICVSNKLPSGTGVMAHTWKTIILKQLVLRCGYLVEDLGSFKNEC